MATYQSTTRRAAPTIHRTISSLHHTYIQTARCELDSHADTCALGSNFVLLHYTGRVCDVAPYNSEAYNPEHDIPIVTAATFYMEQQDGRVYILVIHEGLWFGDKLTHSLINPSQLRYAGLTVQENPFERDPPVSIITNHVKIPLITSGTNIFLELSTPTQTKLDNCPHVHLTLDTEWNPNIVQLACTQRMKAECDYSDTEPGLLQISSIYCLHEMTKSLMSQRNSEAVAVQERKTFISNERHTSITSDQLGERWNIGMKQAQQTLRAITQQCVRSAILPLSRRYRTVRMFNQKKLAK